MGYKIVFYNITANKKSENASCELVRGTEQTDSKIKYLLTDISFHKEVYKPGYIEFVVQFTLSDTDTWTSIAKTGIRNCPIVDLKYGNDVIADTYYIFNVSSKKTETSGSGSVYYATFKAYSIDKFLTIDKFNHAFTGRKLIGSVYGITNSETESSDEKKGIVPSVFTDAAATNAFTKYKCFIKETAGDHGIVASLNHLKETNEAVLPYCVQYDESFYDFLVRTCNRNGEFLYCRDNQLHIGLQQASTEKLNKLQNNGITVPSQTITTELADVETALSVADKALKATEAQINNNTITEDISTQLTTAKTKLETAASNLTKKDSTLTKEATKLSDLATSLDTLNTTFTQDNLSKANDNYGIAITTVKHLKDYNDGYLIVQNYSGLEYNECLDLTSGIGTMNIDCFSEEYSSTDLRATNSIYPPEYLKIIEKEGYSKWEDYVSIPSNVLNAVYAGMDKQAMLDIAIKTTTDIATVFAQAASIRDKVNDKYKNEYFDNIAKESYQPFTNDSVTLDTDFYESIMAGELTSEQKQTTVSFSTCQQYDLGDKVQIENNNYVVYRVNGGYYSTNNDDSKEHYELLLIPIGTENKVYPLPLHDKRIRKSSPQRAIVEKNHDPHQMGRVRVRYQWQKNDTPDATPWIRVSCPAASKESGLMFYHHEGDEVLIDYEEGNVERPYVVGGLYNTNSPIPGPSEAHMHGMSNSLTSANGHHISFSDAKGTNFLANMLPVWKMLQGFGVGVDCSLKEGDCLGGGVEIADKFGFYSITGSTHERKINISSMLGDIELNALTGITINAPLGNVKIVGKNVEIEARNNLKITSGTNIGNPTFYDDQNGKTRKRAKFLHGFLKPQVKALATSSIDFISDFVGIDFELYRTLLEIVFRPIGGTMLIKSNRFMRMEAGEGEASIYRTRKPSKSATAGHFFSHMPIADSSIDATITLVKEACKAYNDLLDFVDGNTSNQTAELIAAVIAYRNEHAYLGNTDYKKTNEEIELVKSMFDSKDVDNKRNINNLTTKNTVLSPVKGHLNTLSNKLVTLQTKLAAFKKYKNLEGWKQYQESIDDISTSIKEQIVAFLQDNASNATYVNPTNQKGKITNVEYRKILIDNVNIYFKKTRTYNTRYEELEIKKDILNQQSSPTAATTGWEVFDNTVLTNSIVKRDKSISREFWEWTKDKALHFEGFVDDNAWGENDKGDIIFSSKQGKSYRIADDGNIVEIENNVINNLINKLIDNKDIQ